MKKTLFLLVLPLVGVYSHAFAAYHLYITNYIRKEESPEWVTLSRYPTLREKVSSPDTYPFGATAKATFYNTFGTGLGFSPNTEVAVLAIGTRDLSRYCFIFLTVDSYLFKDHFKVNVAEERGAGCRFSPKNSNTGRIDIYPLNSLPTYLSGR